MKVTLIDRKAATIAYFHHHGPCGESHATAKFIKLRNQYARQAFP